MARDQEAEASAFDAPVFDLKAVNPNAVTVADERMPDEIIESIAVQGRIVAEALARLKTLIMRWTMNTAIQISFPQALLSALRELIQQGRQRALRAVDVVQVQTCWQIGRHIVEFEQGGETRAAYGKRL